MTFLKNLFPLLGVIVFAAVTYFCTFLILTTRTLSSDLQHFNHLLEEANFQLKNKSKEVDSLRAQLDFATEQLANLKHVQDIILLKGRYPWELCMRFQHQKNCYNTTAGAPPCQIDVLRELSMNFIEAMEQTELTYWATYGTLLGLARNEKVLIPFTHPKIIPWTADVDFALMDTNFGKLQGAFRKAKTLDKYGLLFFFDPQYPDIGRICLTDKSVKYRKWKKPSVIEKVEYFNGYPYIDIYKGVRNGDKIQIRFGPNCLFDQQVVFPLKKGKLYGKEVYIPNNTTKYLTQLYGPNFMTPPEKGTSHGAYSQACRKEWQNL